MLGKGILTISPPGRSIFTLGVVNAWVVFILRTVPRTRSPSTGYDLNVVFAVQRLQRRQRFSYFHFRFSLKSRGPAETNANLEPTDVNSKILH